MTIFKVNHNTDVLVELGYFIGHKYKDKINEIYVTSETRYNDNINSIHPMDVFFIYYSEEKLNIVYNNNDLEIQLIKYDKPLVVHRNIIDVKEMIIKCQCDETVKKFFKEAHTYYESFIKNKSKKKDKINIFIWDEYNWEVIKTQPTRSLDTLYFEDKFINNIEHKISKFLTEDTKNLYKRLGIPYKLNILLEGLPGTGKTSIMTAIASKYNMNMAILHFDNKMTDTMLLKSFSQLSENTILILEDIDVLFKERKENDNRKNALTFSGLINALDGIAAPQNNIIFMTTNYKCNLDKALIRPGRVDMCINFTYTKKEQVYKMFKAFYGDSDHNEIIKSFLEETRRLKYTTATLQQFLFEYIEDGPEEILNHIDKFKKLVIDNKIDNHENLYS
tara:strand:- start:277 stop:1449 length:1173 start_codon:yes stop_codon:yes gene_type:complete